MTRGDRKNGRWWHAGRYRTQDIGLPHRPGEGVHRTETASIIEYTCGVFSRRDHRCFPSLVCYHPADLSPAVLGLPLPVPRFMLQALWAGRTFRGSSTAPPRLTGMTWSRVNAIGSRWWRSVSITPPHSQQTPPCFLSRPYRGGQAPRTAWVRGVAVDTSPDRRHRALTLERPMCRGRQVTR